MWTNEAKMYHAMQKKAGEMGANAIVLDALSEPSAGAKIAGAFLGTGSQRKGKAIGIYVFPGAENVATQPREGPAPSGSSTGGTTTGPAPTSGESHSGNP
jgi:hypothetical protein